GPLLYPITLSLKDAPAPAGASLLFLSLFCQQLLVEPHQNASRLGTGGGASGLQSAVVVAVDECVAVGPGHGGEGPLLYGIAVGEGGKVALGGEVIVLVRCVVVEHLGEFLAGDGLIGTEGSVL